MEHQRHAEECTSTQTQMPACFQCDLCPRTFATNHGKNIHLSTCRKRLGSSQPNPSTTGQQTQSNGNDLNNNAFSFMQCSQPETQIWGSLTKEDVYHTIDQIYNEIVYWKRNLFMLPSGAAGKKFISETTKWIEYWNNDSIYFRDIALKVLMVMPALLLQKPSFKSTSKEHSLCLSRRLAQWESGDIAALLREARTIQDKLRSSTPPNSLSEERLAKTFAKLVFEGKISAAIKLLEQQSSSGVLPLSQTTIDELIRKHPSATEAETSVLINGPTPFVDPVMFQNITESTILNAALKTKGSSGPSGLDADGWRRILVSKNFATTGKNLRCALAAFAQKVSTIEIETTTEDGKSYSNLEAYLACRLIPLDKNPGVRPIGVGEVLRRIVGKAILSVIKPDIISSAGNLQLCAGQASGCEAAVHAIRDVFDAQSTDAVLLVDADNAFNSLNRAVLLHNIRYLCPPMATYIRNCYSTPSRLFVLGGTEILSSEGTTQGDPLAMPVYAIGIIPILEAIKPDDSITHAAFADDLSGAGNLGPLRTWWNNLVTLGPKLGYYPKASKSWLVIKPEVEDEVHQVFAGTDIKITTEGRQYLGGFIGSEAGQSEYIDGLVDSWCNQLIVLSKIARSEPHAAYAAFTSGFRHKLTYYIRTIPNIKPHLAKVDEVIDNTFIPAITEGHVCTAEERLLLSLPVRKGGLAIPVFSNTADSEYANSRLATQQLVTNIKNQDSTALMDNELLKQSRKNIVKAREEQHKTILQQVREKMNKEQLRANDLSMLKGASSWLTTLPLQSENINLSKREFYDALCLRYRWTPKYIPTTCACGKRFDVDHSMSCLKGGFVHRRHDEVRDLFADLLKDVCHDVQVEPQLETLTGEVLHSSANTSDEARLDVCARDFWVRGQRAFFDVRVFNPFAKSHLNQKLATTFTTNENEKKRQYNQRVIQIEHGSFTPLVFTPYGGNGREAERFITELAVKVAKKKSLEYSTIIHWLRVKLSINLIKSAVICLRGSRTVKKYVNTDINDVEISNIYRIE